MALPKSILVPIDFAAPSLRACDRAAELARDLRARVTLLHVVEALPNGVPADAADRLEAAAQRTMLAHAKKLRPFVEELHTVVLTGAPWETILDFVRAKDVDLVVTGTHGRRGFARMALGSVAERVVRSSSAPVLTVPGHAFESREDAGRRLATALASHDLAGAPAVVALSLGAIAVADPVATAHHGTLDVWGTAPIVVGGEVIGTVGEDELAYYDRRDHEPSIAVDTAEDTARGEMREELSFLRGARSIGPLEDRTVVLVADALTNPSIVTSAVRALRPMGVSAFVLATPVASPEARAEVRALVDGVICLETAIVAPPAETAYRRSAPPSYRKARALLDTWRGDAGVERRAS